MFQKKMELYQDFSKNYHQFYQYNYGCFSIDSLRIELEKQNSDNKNDDNENREKKLEILQRFSNLEGAINPMIHFEFNQKIKYLLIEVNKNANIVTDYMTQTNKRPSKIQVTETQGALNFLHDVTLVESELNKEFDEELKLRSFTYYFKKGLSKICSWCSS